MAFTTTAIRQALRGGRAASAWKARVVAALLLCSLPAGAAAESPRPHYVLDVRLDPVRHRVEGSVEVRVEVPERLDQVWLQLYGNGLRSPDSVYQRGRPLEPEARGRTELRSLRVAGEERLAEAEDELLPGDFTRVRLPLAAPLPAGQVLVLRAEFVTTLPTLGLRSGHADDFHMVSQWYPKLAYLTPGGRFAAHAFERQAEFRANHATYDLRVQAPEAYRLEAPGARLQAGEGGRWRFQAGPASDVAFAACRRCEARSSRHGEVAIRQLYTTGVEEAAARQLEVVRAGLDHFGRTIAPYPYAQLSTITPPRNSPLLGMEYPGLLVVPPGPIPLRSHPLLDGRHVTAHELAHQWFYALVGSDEVRFPALDEGLTEWAAGDLLRELGLRPLGLDHFELMRLWTQVGRAPAPPGGWPAYSHGALGYARAVYARPALALESVRRSHGDRRFRQALARYVRDNRFRVATVEDLREAFDAVYGPGFFARTLRPLMLEGERSEWVLDGVERRRVDEAFETRVRAHRDGAPLPTWLVMRDPEGDTLARLPWPQDRRSLEVVAHSADEVTAVQLDPDAALLVDTNRLDHHWQAAATREGHWTSLLFTVLQAWLALWGP